jgi:DNA-binding transcriptional ArsR family regulator
VLERTIDLDRTFQALADESRRSMVERLTLGPATVSELAAPLAMSLAAVLQHVQVLEASGLVRTEKVGRVRTCRIDRSAVTAAERWISEQRRGWEVRLDRLDELLDTEATATEER